MYLLVGLWLLACLPPIKGQNDKIQSCLASISNLSRITQTDSAAYTNASKPYNLRFTPSPAAIVYPTSTDEVSRAVACASSSGMNVSARSGGHSYAAYALSGNMVIDLSNLKNLTVDANGNAVSQTGLQIGELAVGLWNQGQRALPHGSCSHVGTGGHPLYGGFGYYSRMTGLMLDRISSAEVVLANGTVVTASSASNADLFWALRGAGPSFGIVTSWTFSTLPAPSTTVIYHITFSSPLTEDDVTSAITNWQAFAVTAPNELATACVLAPTGAGGIGLTFQGTYYGSSSQFNTTIGALLTRLPPSRTLDSNALGWLESLEAFDGDVGTNKAEKSDTFFVKSLVTTQPYTNDSIAAWVKYLFKPEPNLSQDTLWYVQIDLYGGAIASVSSDATSFAHRDAFMVYQFYASSSSNLPPFPQNGITLLNNVLTALDPSPKAAYPNYVDPTLSSDQWQSLYFGNHMPRLMQIKRDVDPRNIFNFQQAIPPASSSAKGGAPSTSPHSGAPSATHLRPFWSLTLSIILFFAAMHVSGS